MKNVNRGVDVCPVKRGVLKKIKVLKNKAFLREIYICISDFMGVYLRKLAYQLEVCPKMRLIKCLVMGRVWKNLTKCEVIFL